MSLVTRIIQSVDALRSDRQRRVGLLLASGGVAMLLVAAVLAIAIVFRVTDAVDWVEHTYQVRGAVGQAVAALQDVEIAARTDLIASSPGERGDYLEAKASFRKVVGELGKLVSDNPPRVRQADDIAAAAENHFTDLDRTFDGDPAAGLANLARGEAQSGLDEIRGALDRFNEDEHTLLVERQKSAYGLEKTLLVLVLLSLVAAGVASSAVISTSWSYIGDLRAQADALKAETESRLEAQGLLIQAQKLELVGQLTAGIAHDFNNLLTIVIGNLDNARRRLATDAAVDRDRLARSIETSMEGATRAATLTQRLLAFSRQQPLAPRRIDINKVVAGISEVLTRTVGETIQIETVLAGGLWPAFADPHQVDNAIVNLVVNARDAMPDGGHVTIETANAHLDELYVSQFGDVTAGQYVLLSVSDTGTGISPEILSRVFDPFFTTKLAGKGTGLGLAMIHGFVKQSKGHIRVYSEPGHGTTVKIYLPRMTGPAVAAAPEIERKRGEELPRALADEVVLVVEDDEGVREFALSALSNLGYRVLHAKDGAEGLAYLRSSQRIDLLFTDVVLPGAINGRHLADESRRMRPALPVLFTTGYTRNAIVHDGRLDPDVTLLSKPYTQDILAQALRRMLDEAQTES